MKNMISSKLHTVNKKITEGNAHDRNNHIQLRRSTVSKNILTEEKSEDYGEQNQNRRQNVFNRVCVSVGGLWFYVGGLDILKIDKNSTDL